MVWWLVGGGAWIFIAALVIGRATYRWIVRRREAHAVGLRRLPKGMEVGTPIIIDDLPGRPMTEAEQAAITEWYREHMATRHVQIERRELYGEWLDDEHEHDEPDHPAPDQEQS
jgi:hypothetical protein